MSKTTLTKVPDENSYYNFEDLMDIDKERFIICGNSHFRNIGDEKFISIVENTYYDDEVGYDYNTFEMLKKVTGKDWTETTLRGYSQGDWQTLYYIIDDSTIEELETIENFYMGKITEFKVDEGDDCIYHDFVPDDIVWKGKKSICKYLGLKEEETSIYEDDGYEKIYKYKEIV